MNDPVPLPPPPAAWGVDAGAPPRAGQPAWAAFTVRQAPPPGQALPPGYVPGPRYAPAPGYPPGHGYRPLPGAPPTPYPGPHPWGHPAGYPPVGPRRPRRWPILAAVLGFVVALVLCGGTAAVVALRPAADGPAATFVDPRPDTRDAALRQLLERRTKAVREKDKKAFMADVDANDSLLVAKQGLLYDNLVKLPFAEFGFEMEKSVRYNELIPAVLRQRHPQHIWAPGVTLRYRIEGLDERPLAVPWVPVFALVDGAWRVVGEISDASLPHGANGQPWDAPVPIAVVRSARVVLVLEATESGRAEVLLRTAERSMDRVLAVRPAGWPGKVLVVALRDPTVFKSYFRNSPGPVTGVVALASPQFDQVLGWHTPSGLTAGRVVLSPDLLDEPREQSHAITHEFAHVAMFPVSASGMPMWLLEGFAEYVAYRQEPVPTSGLRRALSSIERGTGLPSDASFRGSDAGSSYVLGWLACRMIAERYGEAKLIALYEVFMKDRTRDAAVQEILGIDFATLDAQVAAYIDETRDSL